MIIRIPYSMSYRFANNRRVEKRGNGLKPFFYKSEYFKRGLPKENINIEEIFTVLSRNLKDLRRRNVDWQQRVVARLDECLAIVIRFNSFIRNINFFITLLYLKQKKLLKPGWKKRKVAFSFLKNVSHDKPTNDVVNERRKRPPSIGVFVNLKKRSVKLYR